MDSLVCKNKKVIEFYNEHSSLDFETMNITFITIMQNLMQDMNSSLNNTIATQLLNNMQGLQSQINLVSENVIKLQSETIINFSAKFSEFKRDYIEDVKMVLTSNSINTIDKIAPLIKEYNSILLDKTQLLLNEVVPKNNEQLTKELKGIIIGFHSSISEETNYLLKTTVTQESLTDFITKLDNKFLNAQTNSQQILNALITSTEHRLDSRINEIKTSTEQHIHDIKNISSTNQQSQSLLQNNVADLLKKMEISSVKGKCSENILFNILQSLYSTAQIDMVGEQKETGDIILKRKNKPTILIENKNWSKNVTQEEVKKFLRDVEIQNCCGLFLSQNHGIANKENFEIDVNNGNVLLYVHQVNNDAEKIRTAIDIIDNFKFRLDEININAGDEFSIDKDVLDDINKEYQLFSIQKIAQLKSVKDFSQKMIKQIDDIQFPSMEKYLMSRFAFSSNKYVCEVCGYLAKNQSAMSAHKRGCKGVSNNEQSCIETEVVLKCEPNIQELLQISPVSSISIIPTKIMKSKKSLLNVV